MCEKFLLYPGPHLRIHVNLDAHIELMSEREIQDEPTTNTGSPLKVTY